MQVKGCSAAAQGWVMEILPGSRRLYASGLILRGKFPAFRAGLEATFNKGSSAVFLQGVSRAFLFNKIILG
jgi:hypothetical protein